VASPVLTRHAALAKAFGERCPHASVVNSTTLARIRALDPDLLDVQVRMSYRFAPKGTAPFVSWVISSVRSPRRRWCDVDQHV
jgi:hypothetical protein